MFTNNRDSTFAIDLPAHTNSNVEIYRICKRQLKKMEINKTTLYVQMRVHSKLKRVCFVDDLNSPFHARSVLFSSISRWVYVVL